MKQVTTVDTWRVIALGTCEPVDHILWLPHPREDGAGLFGREFPSVSGWRTLGGVLS